MAAFELPWDSETGRSLAEKVAARTAKRIVQGQLAAGELITEVELATTEGTSRTPAREAMLKLQSWGLVRLIPKKGGVITTITEAQRRDLIDVRSTWEIRSVQLVITDEQRRDALVTELRAIMTQQQVALDAGDLLGFARHDVQFHLRIIAAGGNQIIDELLEHLGPRLARLTVEANTGTDLSHSFRSEHEALVELIAASNAQGFAEAVRQHVHHGIFGKNN